MNAENSLEDIEKGQTALAARNYADAVAFVG
jgi:hypothetical protein